MNDQLASRLYNFKFGQATAYLEGEDDSTKNIINALSDTFGDVGWGLEGNMGLIVWAVVTPMLPKDAGYTL